MYPFLIGLNRLLEHAAFRVVLQSICSVQLHTSLWTGRQPVVVEGDKIWKSGFPLSQFFAVHIISLSLSFLIFKIGNVYFLDTHNENGAEHPSTVPAP